MSRAVRIGFLGLGNIGSGLYRLIRQNGAEIEQSEGISLSIERALVRDINKKRNADLPRTKLTLDVRDIIEDESLCIIAEFLGGIEPATTYMEECLKRGKMVVSANKEAIAANWDRLLDAAESGGGKLFYEASVCGGIPVIRTILDSLQGNHIKSIKGIINGTTNYILCRMSSDGMSYSEAITQAQKLGYAEPDPKNDVEGYDARSKLSILSTLAFHSHVATDEIYTEGITHIEPVDIARGRSLGYDIKLLGIAKMGEEGIEARVHPAFIPMSHPLTSVRDAYNAVFIEGDAVGSLMLYGRGAGDMPTASAMLSDIVSAARGNSPALPQDRQVRVLADWKSKYYIRLEASDEPGVLADIAGVLGTLGISIAACMQNQYGEKSVPIIIITHPTLEGAINKARTALEALDRIKRVATIIRVEE